MKNSMYDPGELDQKVDFYRLVRTPDASGGFAESQELIKAGVWANIVPGNGGEVYEFEQVHTVQRVTWIIRKRADITEKDILIWRGETFNIRLIPKDNPRWQYMTLETETGAGI